MKWMLLKTILLSVFISAQAFAQAAGPNEGGGGNGIFGRPLESYVVDISQTYEFKKHVLPVLNKIKSLVPTYGAILEQSVTSKNWYFVPVRLNGLSSKTIGTPFSTDQLAYQGERAVWIDTLYYNDRNNTSLSRGSLLLHEMVMAEKLKYKLSLKIRPNPILTPYDYDTVRETTAFLMSDKINSMNGDELAHQLHEMGVFGYEDNPPLPDSSITHKIYTIMLAKMLYPLFTEGGMPSHNIATPSSDCRYSNFNYEPATGVFSFTMSAPADFQDANEKSLHFSQETFKISDASLIQKDTPDHKATVLTIPQAALSIIGTERLTLKINLNTAGIQFISLLKEVFSFDMAKGANEWKIQSQLRLPDGTLLEGFNQCRPAK